MSKPYFKAVIDNNDFQLYEDTCKVLPAEREGRYYIWDKLQKVNIVSGAITQEEAFMKALVYYRYDMLEAKRQYNYLNNRVNSFVSQFVEDED